MPRRPRSDDITAGTSMFPESHVTASSGAFTATEKQFHGAEEPLRIGLGTQLWLAHAPT
jgi:hypothetical protein